MTYVAETYLGETITLNAPIYVRMNSSEDAPADDINVVFPINDNVDELCKIKVYQGDTLIFNGIVDKQQISYDIDGAILKIQARSTAAILLDNEAMPQNYNIASFADIFNRHAKPYGFNLLCNDDRTFCSDFHVYKGMSEWEVLSDFCKQFLSTFPRVDHNNNIYLGTNHINNGICFSNTQDGVRYTSISKTINRHYLYSVVKVRTDNNGQYDTVVLDEDSIRHRINKTRYFSAVDSKNNSIQYINALLQRSRKKAMGIDVICPTVPCVKVSEIVSIDDPIIGKIENLVVYSTQYILSNTGEFSRISLRRSD